MKKIFIILGLTFIITGCSYTELNDLAIASAVGIDYENNKFHLTAQIMDAKNNNGSMEEGALIYESEGPTLAKAIRNFSNRYPKNVYFGHLEFIVMSEDAVNNKLEDIFDYFTRAPEVRNSGFVVTTINTKARDILNPNNETKGSFPTENLKSTFMDSNKRSGLTNGITFEEFLSIYLKKGITPVIPLIKNTKDKGITASSTIIEQMVPIKNKVNSPLNEKQAIIYNTINNNYYDLILDSKYKNKPFAAVIYNPKSKIDVKIKDNKINVNININIESKIREIDKKVNLNNRKIHNNIKNIINKELENYTYELINYCKDNNTDILGIGNTIYKNYYNDYNKYKDKNFYEEANFKVKVTNKVYRYGNINKGAA